MLICKVIKTGALMLMLGGLGLSSVYAEGFSDVWEQVKEHVENFVENHEIDPSTEHGAAVANTLNKYTTHSDTHHEKGIDNNTPHIHDTVHHLLAAKNAIQEEIEHLPEEAGEKAREFVDDIHHALNTITTLDATHQVVTTPKTIDMDVNPTLGDESTYDSAIAESTPVEEQGEYIEEDEEEDWDD